MKQTVSHQIGDTEPEKASVYCGISSSIIVNQASIFGNQPTKQRCLHHRTISPSRSMMMMPSFSSPPPSRVAVVTGANKGIGYFIALQLGLSGLFSDVIIACRDARRGGIASMELQEELSKRGAACGTSNQGGIAGGAASSEITTTRRSTATIHSLPLTIGDAASHSQFYQRMEEEFGRVDVLINNAGFAYKGSDPTPFEGQTQKTLETNYFGLVDFTETMLPLLRKNGGTGSAGESAGTKGGGARIVNVASMAGRLSQVSPALQAKFSAADLTIPQLNQLMRAFSDDVQNGVHRKNGWSDSNYGMSKLGVIAATKVWARREAAHGISVNACCPGYCATDMSSHRGTRSAEEGARNAIIPATIVDPPTGEFFRDFKVSKW